MAKVEEAAKRFSGRIRRWELDWVSIYFQWSGRENIQQSVNNWLNSFEEEWKSGMFDVNKISSISAYRTVRGQARGMGNDFLEEGFIPEAFEQSHGGLVSSSTAQDVLTGRAQRNVMAMTFKKELIKMYQDFDKIVQDGSGLSLRAKVAKFMQQPTYSRAVHLVDKAGRKWKPGNYAAMYSRTRGSEIFNKTTLSEMNDLGMDLVQVIDIDTTTPICSKYVGKYFSLTGKTPGFPVLDITPPFHPNCVHSLITPRPADLQDKIKQNRKLDKGFSSEDLTKAQQKSIDRQEEYIRLNRPNVYAGAEAV